ncbi:MAG: hypothetical protein ACYC7D_05675 [Nitrososphaerales archaeon]
MSSVIGGVIIFGLIFTVGFGYFYTMSQDQQILQTAQRQNSNLLALKNQENLYLVTNVGGGGNLTFTVNNTGIATALVGYFISDQTGKILQFETGSNPTSSCLDGSKSPIPCILSAGSSAYFDPTPQISYTPGTYYTVKVLTERGSSVIGTYPTQQLSESSLTSLVASGLGSLEMIFSSFEFYNYSSTSPWKVNLSSAEPAAITPYNKPIVFSAQVTNNDPSGGTIVVDAHTDLWTFLSCGSGCGSQTTLSFYVMNVASDGTVTSTSYNSYVPIQIPYGSTKTIYFGSSCDLSTSSCSSFSSQSVSDSENEHDVFMIFSGTLVTAKNSTLYSQNLPFAATFTSDNIASYSETPTTCGNGSSTTFSLQVTNTNWSPSGDKINKVVVEAPTFNPPTTQPTAPSGWAVSVNSGTITWTTSGSYIVPGQTLKFSWQGTAPVVNTGTQVTFISNVNWNSGTIQSQPINTGCFVG